MNDNQVNAAAGAASGAGRIVLVISSLQGGGAERVMALLASEWVRRGRPVSLITLDDAQDMYEVAPGVERVRLGVAGASSGAVDALRNNCNRLRTLRRAILSRQPHAVISFMDQTNILTLMALAGSGVPVVVSQRVDPRHYPVGKGWAWLRRRLYPGARAVVVQTEAVAEWAREFVPAEKVRVIPNPVVAPTAADEDPAPAWLPSGRFVAAMGRLDRQKGFDLLLRAFAALPTQFDDVELVIMGEGHERPELENLAASLGITKRLMLPGRVQPAWPVLSRCSVFVLSSRFEGFPNALLEAMAMGAPVVSYKCPSGPAEMIQHGIDGLLVEPEDVEGLTRAMMQLLADDHMRQQISVAARGVRNRWGIEQVTDQWETLL